MFQLKNNNISSLVDALLQTNKDEQILNILNEQDNNQLIYARNSIIQKMPKELHLFNQFATTQMNKQYFPYMFESNNKKTYQYVRENIEDMKKITGNYSRKIENHQQIIRIPTMSNMDVINLQKKQQENQQIKHSNLSESHGQNKKIAYSQFSMGSNKNEKPIKNPFVPNNINFTDNFANSKSLQQKYQHLNFTQNSRNFTAIGQECKYNAFSSNSAYPTSIMSGTLQQPRVNTFSKQTKLDVQDIMRYTLGVKRPQSCKKPTENPFMRPPKRKQQR